MKHSLNIISSFALLIQTFLYENTHLPDGKKRHAISPAGKSEFRFTGHGTTMMKGYREPPRVEREDCQAIPKQDMIRASLMVRFLT